MQTTRYKGRPEKSLTESKKERQAETIMVILQQDIEVAAISDFIEYDFKRNKYDVEATVQRLSTIQIDQLI